MLPAHQRLCANGPVLAIHLRLIKNAELFLLDRFMQIFFKHHAVRDVNLQLGIKEAQGVAT